MDFVWNHWQVVAWIAPIAWATSSLIDVLLVNGRFYRDEIDGVTISTLFGALPCLVLAIASNGIERTDVATGALAFLAGLSFAIHTYAYFRALFQLNDAAQVDSTFNAYVVVVPVLAFLCLGEHLSDNHYLGIALATIGVAFIARAAPRELRRLRTGAVLVLGVLSLSATLVVMDSVYARCNFWTGTFWSTLGWCGGAYGFWKLSGRRGALAVARKHAGLFSFNEAVGGIAVLGTLRATDLSPSVSFIPVIECTSPVIILAMSLTAVVVLRLHPRWHGHRSYGAFRAQLRTTPTKLAATAFILGGVYVINLPAAPDLAALTLAIREFAETFTYPWAG